MKPLTREDADYLYQTDPYRWNDKMLSRLEDVAIALNRPELHDDIVDILNIIWTAKLSTNTVTDFKNAVWRLYNVMDIITTNMLPGVSNEAYDFLSSKLEDDIKNYRLNYNDNYRFCRCGNAESEAYYRARQKAGCCGSWDKTISFDGEDYRYGCNYGH